MSPVLKEYSLELVTGWSDVSDRMYLSETVSGFCR